MTRYRVDRKCLTLKEGKFNDFFTIVCTNIIAKPEFVSLVAKGTAMKLKLEQYRTAYLLVNEGDMREKANRNNYYLEAQAMGREIADAVNILADGDAAVITAAGFVAVTTPSKDRPMGETYFISVEFLPNINQLKLRCREADRAADYQIDISTDGTTWEEGVDSMPLTLFYIKWKRLKGHYFIRLCPRDKDGVRGATSNVLEVTIY